MTTEAAASNQSVPADEIIAEPDPGYRWKHLIMTVLMIAGGLWFAYDGWVKWPNENALIKKLQADKIAANNANNQVEIDRISKELTEHSPHTELDLAFQKVLAFSLPILGIAYGVWTWQTTRGRYRLEGNT